MALAIYILLALVALAGAIYACSDDIVHFLGTKDAEQKAEARAIDQMNGRLADQKTIK